MTKIGSIFIEINGVVTNVKSLSPADFKLFLNALRERHGVGKDVDSNSIKRIENKLDEIANKLNALPSRQVVNRPNSFTGLPPIKPFRLDDSSVCKI